MKTALLPAFILFVLASCKTTNNLVSPQAKTPTINDVIFKLNKNKNDKNAARLLPILYAQLQREQLNKIDSYKNDNSLNRWADIFNEYKILQNAYDTINKYSIANSLVTAANYQKNIDSVRQHAAQDYYQQAIAIVPNEREAVKRSYVYFGRADYWVPGFKDAQIKMNEAFDKAVINVVVNSAQADSVLYINKTNFDSLSYFNNSFLQAAVKDLGDTGSVYFPAKFYTLSQSKNLNIVPDWIIDVTLVSADVPAPVTYNYSNKINQRVDEGLIDTLQPDRKNYIKTYAELNVKNKWIKAQGNIELKITAVSTQKIISTGIYPVKYTWTNTQAIPTGDMLAFTSRDWELINKTTFEEELGKMDILAALYNKAYPQIKNAIINAVGF